MQRRSRLLGWQSQVPWTPIIWLVLWVTVMLGFLKGYASGPGVLYSSAFRSLWFSEVVQVTHGIEWVTGEGMCELSSWTMRWYIAAKYFVGCAACLPVGWLTALRGRRVTIMAGCTCYVLAHLLQGTAVRFEMLVAAQVMHGLSAACLYQAPYLNAAEVAPTGWRGGFVYADLLGRSFGIWMRMLLHAGMANEANAPWGWRLTSLFPVWPATAVLLMVPLLPETAHALVQRGKLEAGWAALAEIRGVLYDGKEEFSAILAAASIVGPTTSVMAQLRTMVRRDQLPPLLIILMAALLRHMTGGDFLSLWLGPILTKFGWATNMDFLFLQAVCLGYTLAALAAALTVDRWGRRATLIGSTVLSAACFAATAAAYSAALHGAPLRPALLAVLVCTMIAYFAFVYGQLEGFYLLVAEMFPLGTRSVASSLSSALVLLLNSLSALFALRWLCRLAASLFLTYAVCSVASVVLFALLLPETACVPLEHVNSLFQTHWLWRRFFTQQQQQQEQQQQQRAGAQQSGGTAAGRALLQHQGSSVHGHAFGTGSYASDGSAALQHVHAAAAAAAAAGEARPRGAPRSPPLAGAPASRRRQQLLRDSTMAHSLSVDLEAFFLAGRTSRGARSAAPLAVPPPPPGGARD